MFYNSQKINNIDTHAKVASTFQIEFKMDSAANFTSRVIIESELSQVHFESCIIFSSFQSPLRKKGAELRADFSYDESKTL